MVNTLSKTKWNIKDLFFKNFIVVDTVGCDKERGLSFAKGPGGWSCPCPNPCGCPVQRK